MHADTIIDGYCTPGTERETAVTADALLYAMDVSGVAAAVICPEDREIAWANTAGNDRILALAAANPERLIPACSITPWSGERGLDELRRAAERGARMLVLHPMLQGFLPNDDLLDPLVAEAGRVNMPVYLHTGPHTGGSPAQVLFLSLRHPGTRFILGHAGATDHSYDLRPLADQLPSNLWIELSFVRPWTLSGLLSRFGEDRLIFGSGFPRNPMPFELRQADSMLPVRSHPSIYRGNLLRVLGLMDSPFAMAGCSR
ncbi:MAG TPA: amidohydrolase family protein [Phycisphaeraceae bacterium]